MFGMSMVMMPVMTNGLNQLPQRFNPHGTAMNNTLQQVSGAIGSALLVTVMSNRTATHAKELAQDAMSGAGAANATAAGAAQMKEQIGMQAMVQGINDAFAVSVVLVVVALILSLFMKRATPASEDEVIKEKAGREQFAK
jgi:cytochrome bd-type quinol oxidase subunit 2